MPFAFDAYVTAALFDVAGRAAFALGDGTVRFEDGSVAEAHAGAILSAAAHPYEPGLITGGDDGRLAHASPAGVRELASVPGRWIEAVAAAPATGLAAFAAGKEARVISLRDSKVSNVFVHERTVADLVFDPKGRRLACATYGGAALWWATVTGQKPQWLKWAGSHIGLIYSPDGKFLISSMQENQLHGWRLSDSTDMRMGGYPAKIRSMAFLLGGRLMATSGAAGAVIWPFASSSGPMNQQAAEVGYQEDALVLRVAAAPDKGFAAAGLDDGRVWTADLSGVGVRWIKAEKGPPITALAVSPDGARLAWGDEDGGAGLADLAEGA